MLSTSPRKASLYVLGDPPHDGIDTTSEGDVAQNQFSITDGAKRILIFVELEAKIIINFKCYAAQAKIETPTYYVCSRVAERRTHRSSHANDVDG